MKTICYLRRPHRPLRMRTGFWGLLAAVGLTVVLAGAASGAPPTKPTAIRGCPSDLSTFLAANNVDAFFTVNGGTATYTFASLQDENPVSGVPGLVGYCVYTDTAPTGVTATYDDWKADQNTGWFSFVRPKGEKSNIPLDGTSTVVGIATWSATPPTSQTILLHISDATVCQAIYGGDASTCFVFPKPGPICNAGTGNTAAAYNAIPFDVQHCGPPSLGFEATQTNEFGDEVTLDTTAGTVLATLTVDFQSYGCSDSGHWNTGATEPCVTTAGETFKVPGGITAKIYNATDLTTAIATAMVDPNIPFRPSADATNCPQTGNQGPNDTGSRWFDPVSGACNYSLSVPITFTFLSGPAFANGDHVVWTVQFNTTHYGYNPIGEATLCFVSDPGCGYDSLNVGTKSYLNAPYAGTDVSEDTAFRSSGSGNLVSETGWTGFRPLGEITLAPAP